MNKKRILCFGDSNTFGYDPASGGRYDDGHRWPSVMQTMLGNEYEIVSEGLSGRTAMIEDPEEPFLRAGDYFLPCLLSHMPLFGLFVMLGTNDVCYGAAAADICGGIERIAGLAASLAIWDEPESPKKNIVIVAPAGICMPKDANAEARECQRMSDELEGLLRGMAARRGYRFFNAGDHAAVGKTDALHLTPDSHVSLGMAAAEYVRKEFV